MSNGNWTDTGQTAPGLTDGETFPILLDPLGRPFVMVPPEHYRAMRLSYAGVSTVARGLFNFLVPEKKELPQQPKRKP